jgi:hypothetical protein
LASPRSRSEISCGAVFAKTDSHRQSELVALLSRLQGGFWLFATFYETAFQ